MLTVESTGCVMILKSQNQGGALWYHLPESIGNKDFFFCYQPHFVLEEEKKIVLVVAFLQSARHFTKKNMFFKLNLLLQSFNNK